MREVIKKIGIAVWILTIIFFSLRLWIDLSTPLPSRTSYAFIEEAKEMLHGRIPLVGITIPRGYPTFPFMIYIYLPFILVGESIGIKILDALLYALLLPVAYLLLKSIIKEDTTSLLGAVIVMLLPIHSYFVNSASIVMVSVLLYILTIYLFLERRRIGSNSLITLLLILSLATPLAIIVAISMILYVLFERLLEKKIDKVEAELAVFYFLFTLWKTLIMYKDIIVHHRLIELNNYEALLAGMFNASITGLSSLLFTAIYILLGIIGLIILYNERKKAAKIITANIVIMIATIASGFMSSIDGLLILLFLLLPGVTMLLEYFMIGQAKLTKKAIETADLNIKRYKEKTRKAVSLIIISLLIVLSIPNISNSRVIAQRNSPTILEVECLKNIAPLENVGISCLNDEAFLVHYYSRKQPVVIRYGKLTEEEQGIEKLIEELMKTPLETRALEISHELGIGYIYISRHAMESLNIKKPLYLETECFKKICENNESILYRVEC
ncbi:hypothetical protein J7K74_03235 [Candidatus Woesearchaeota archaeon]|nr:hypothetical protein [Candidatus Woesearchaeota archaeon]